MRSLVVVIDACIALRLGGEEMKIFTALRHQFLVGAVLNNGAVLKNDNVIRLDRTREAVGDEEGDFSLGKRGEALEYICLGEGVECRSGLVENENIGVLIEGSRDRKLLPLTA